MKTNIEIEMTIGDIVAIAENLPRDIDATIVFKTNNIGTAQLIRGILMRKDAVTDEQLDEEEQIELEVFKRFHPEFDQISSN